MSREYTKVRSVGDLAETLPNAGFQPPAGRQDGRSGGDKVRWYHSSEFGRIAAIWHCLLLCFAVTATFVAVAHQSALASEIGEVGDSPQIIPFSKLPDDIKVKSMFDAEFPAAYEKLVQSVSKVKGCFKIEQSKRSSYLFFCIYEQHLKARMSSSKARNEASISDNAILVTPSQAYLVRSPLTPSAVVSSAGERPGKHVSVLMNNDCRRYLDAVYSVDGFQVYPRLMKGDFRYISGYIDPADSNVVISFAFTNSDPMWGENRPAGIVDISFDRKNNWAIRKFILVSGPPFNYVAQATVEVKDLVNVGVVPSSMHFESYDKAEPADSGNKQFAPILTEVYDSHLEEIEELKVFPANEFTLESLGLANPDVASNRLTLLVLFNFGVFLCFAAWFFFRKRRRGVS